jgi:CRISPR-associated protein Cpf1
MNDFADPEKVPNKRWTITTMEGDGGDSRYYYDNKKKQDKNSLGTEVNEQLISLDPITKVNVNERVIQLFKRYDINYEQHDLTSIILSKDLDSQFFKEFVWLLGILLRLRYIDNSNKDYILSPVKHNGKLFNSLLYTGHELPRDPDANGAYHIALKGLYTIQKQILHAKPNDKGMYNIKPMTNLQWLNYLYEIHSTK